MSELELKKGGVEVFRKTGKQALIGDEVTLPGGKRGVIVSFSRRRESSNGFAVVQTPDGRDHRVDLGSVGIERHWARSRRAALRRKSA